MVSPTPPEFLNLLKEALTRQLLHPGFDLENGKFHHIRHIKIKPVLSSPCQVAKFNGHLHTVGEQAFH